MPVRIYTVAPARELTDDRPFGIVAWKDDSHLGEVYAIVHLDDGTPVLRGKTISLTSTELQGSIEHALRVHLEDLWQGVSEIGAPAFEELLEEIPVEEFALTQIEKPEVRGVVAQMTLEAQVEDLANAFAKFHQTRP